MILYMHMIFRIIMNNVNIIKNKDVPTEYEYLVINTRSSEAISSRGQWSCYPPVVILQDLSRVKVV